MRTVVAPPEFNFTHEMPVVLLDWMGNDDRVVYAARTSTSPISELPSVPMDDLKLIPYLMKHRHGTPFEHTALQFAITAPIFVWREFHRHRIGFSYNEESARYSVLKPNFYIPPAGRPMIKVDNWKPGRPKFLTLEEAFSTDKDGAYNPFWEAEARQLEATIEDNLVEIAVDAYRRYQEMLAADVDPGLARDVLPVNTMSTCWVTCNLRSVLHFLSLRTHEPTATFVSYPLYEIEVVARQIEEYVKDAFPVSYEAFVNHGRVAP